MSKISLTLIQQVASIVQPICTKSDLPEDSTSSPETLAANAEDILKVYNADWLFEQTVNMIAQMILEFKAGDKGVIQWARKEGLIGDKATMLSAVSDIQKMANARKELHFKYKKDDKVIQKKITADDMKIIEAFIRRMPEKLASRVLEGKFKDGDRP